MSSAMMRLMHTYSIVVDPDEATGYTVTVPSLPGCVTHGETVDECLENAREAIQLYIETLAAAGDPVPEEHEHPQVFQVIVAA